MFDCQVHRTISLRLELCKTKAIGLPFLVMLLLGIGVEVSGQASFDQKTVSVGNIGLNMTTVGTIEQLAARHAAQDAATARTRHQSAVSQHHQKRSGSK